MYHYQHVKNYTLGKGTWQLATQVLHDQQYNDIIERLWEDHRGKKEEYSDTLQWCDGFKIRIKKVSRDYTYKQHLDKEKYIHSIDRRLRNLRKKANPDRNTSDFIQHLTHLKQQREEESALQHIKKSKTQWIEEGEKCSKFFLNLETKRKQNTIIHEHTSTKGTTLITSEDILEETTTHYKTLYTKRAEAIENSNNTKRNQNFFLATLEKHLTEQQAALCEGPLKSLELKKQHLDRKRIDPPDQMESQ